MQDEELQLVELLREIGRDALIWPPRPQLSHSQVWPALQQVKQQAGGVTVVGFSAETLAGRDELWRAILKRAGISG